MKELVKPVSFVKPKKRRKQKKLVQEIRMLRELAWWFFRDRKCYFCKKRFIEEKLARSLKFGRRSHKPFKQKLTQHHRDEDRQHNEDDNLKWCHQSCHKAYHMKQLASKMKMWDVQTILNNAKTLDLAKTSISIRAVSKESAIRNAKRKGYHFTKVTTVTERKKS